MRARDKAEGTPPIDRIVKMCYSAVDAQNVIIVFKQEHPKVARVEYIIPCREKITNSTRFRNIAINQSTEGLNLPGLLKNYSIVGACNYFSEVF
jgi:hypothetical protein